MSLDFNELRQLLIALDQTDITELTLKSDEFELTVRKAVAEKTQLLPAADSIVNNMIGGLNSSPIAGSSAASGINSVPSQMIDSTISNSLQMPAAIQPLEQKSVEISSPMVGTFYRAAAPGEPPFVEIGDRVRVGQTVCIIEAMKLMNEIEAEVSGQIIDISVHNGEPVEYGQALMRINPD